MACQAGKHWGRCPRTRAVIRSGFLTLAVTVLACINGRGAPADEVPDGAGKAGNVWAWGDNFFGQCGHNNGIRSVFGREVGRLATGGYLPRPVPEVGAAIAIAAGWHHSMALDTDGSVWTWGNNDDGQLGRGTTSWSSPPGRIPGLAGVRAITAGAGFSLAILNNGTVRAWGVNDAGQLGDGTTENRASPVQVLGLTDVKAAAASRGFTVTLKHDGTVWAWGYNGYGQLGDGTKENRKTPVRVGSLEHVKSVACGDGSTIALKEDGTVWGCGFNRYGDLGDGTEINRTSAVQVKGLDEVVAIACGSNHTLAVKKDGTVWGWGYGNKGQLGMGLKDPPGRRSGGKRNIAGKIPGLHNIKAVACGWDYSLATDHDSVLWAWGRNWGGYFGIKEPRDSFVPIKIAAISDIKQIVSGTSHSVAIRLKKK